MTDFQDSHGGGIFGMGILKGRELRGGRLLGGRRGLSGGEDGVKSWRGWTKATCDLSGGWLEHKWQASTTKVVDSWNLSGKSV